MLASAKDADGQVVLLSQPLREEVRFLEQKLMHEHLYVALTLHQVLASPVQALQTCIACFSFAMKSQRPSAFKAIEMIVKRQTRLLVRPEDLNADHLKQAFSCLLKVIELGAEDSTANIKQRLRAFALLKEQSGSDEGPIAELFSAQESKLQAHV